MVDLLFRVMVTSALVGFAGAYYSLFGNRSEKQQKWGFVVFVVAMGLSFACFFLLAHLDTTRPEIISKGFLFA